MNYDTLLYTRGYEKDEDYHWVCCADYVDKRDILPLNQVLFNLRSSMTSFVVEESKYIGLFLIFKKYCVLLRAFSSKNKDSAGRVIFSVEGLTCQLKDVNFLFLDIPNIVSEWKLNNSTFQDLYFEGKLENTYCCKYDTNIIDYIFGDKTKERNVLSSVYLNFINEVQINPKPQSIIIGNNAKKLALKIDRKECKVIDTQEECQLTVFSAPVSHKANENHHVIMKLNGELNRKGDFLYNWRVYQTCNLMESTSKNLCFETIYSEANKSIEVTKLMKEGLLIKQILSAQGYDI